MKNERLRGLVIQAWSGMLALLIMMMVVDVVTLGQRGDLSALRRDPGSAGLWFIAACAATSVFMQMLLRSQDKARCRWIFFAITGLYTLVFIGHQVVHLAGGEGVGPNLVVDLSHHAVGIWGTVAAYRWASRLPDASQSAPA